MRRCNSIRGVALIVAGLCIACMAAAEPSVERGRKAMSERSFQPPIWSPWAYAHVWKQWQTGKEPPAEYENFLMERYGLHKAPYANHDLPMGLRKMKGLGGDVDVKPGDPEPSSKSRKTNLLLGTGITTDCLLCHGGSIMGKSYVGLGNSSLDMQALYEELAAADGRAPTTPFPFSNVRGTTEAGAMAVALFSIREPDLTLRKPALDLGLCTEMCEDAPAWWLLKKKKTMYHTGSSDARSVRSIMQFMLSPLNSPSMIKQEEETFADIQAYLLSMEPPKYPFAVDAELAKKGEAHFRNNCTKCHGSYGKEWTYPNKVVPIDKIGTDRKRFEGFTSEAAKHYNRSWFAKEKAGWLADDCAVRATAGYQAPPLDGIWATAPYFHNGSAPTVYHVLNSKARPKFFTRSYRTGKDDYDSTNLGWKIKVLDQGADPKSPGLERRRIYDTTRPGQGNAGHTYGDDLSDDERKAIIEYLKTL